MKSHYEKDIFRQLQEMMEKCDKLEKKVDDTKKAAGDEIKKAKEEFRGENKALKKEIKELKTENKALKKELTEVKNENKALKKENAKLKNENSKLRSQLNNDSNNSSLPPSTDQKGSKPKKTNEYNSREKSIKKCGGQDGHSGHTLKIEDIHRMIKSGTVKHTIVDIGKPSNRYITRYVLDYEITPIVREYRFYEDEKQNIQIPIEFRPVVTYGKTIKAIAVQLYSEGVVANDRIQEFLNAIGNNALSVSTGSIYNFVKSFAQKCKQHIENIKAELMKSEVLCTDATNVTVDGKQTYIRNVSNANAVLYSGLESKSEKGIRDNTILSEYKGILIHDHEKTLYNFGVGHGECNVHVLRYLKKNTEETNNQWSIKLSELLVKINREKKNKILLKTWFSEEETQRYEKRYGKIIREGYKENKKTELQYAKKDERTLLNRLAEYKDNHLLFMYDSRVPFDNNTSERDLRKCKNRQKMAGGFRKLCGLQMFCNILSVIETAKRTKAPVFQKILSIFQEQPTIE